MPTFTYETLKTDGSRQTGQLAADDRAQLGFANLNGLSDAGLARVAVKIGGDDQPRARQRVAFVEIGPLAAG